MKILGNILLSLFLIIASSNCFADDKKLMDGTFDEGGTFEKLLDIVGDNAEDHYDELFKEAHKAQQIVLKYIEKHWDKIIEAFQNRNG